jgi:hypothetical protein
MTLKLTRNSFLYLASLEKALNVTNVDIFKDAFNDFKDKGVGC